ncbi:uncharacterized protein LOC124286003 [Haliotis rubra]|uniref:uncharacterized protein LOC124286003 n=1 Tax=Haliotis rubra TaxID=36100 RepID=UPI001EE5B314|nr:uncharacterized protein LOC124286003 [Haliotis rubra]
MQSLIQNIKAACQNTHIFWYYIIYVLSASWCYAGNYSCTNEANSITRIEGVDSGSIYTRLEGQTFYDNNYDCRWLIDAGAGKRVHGTVVSSHLQWAPENAICTGGYDYLHVRDGMDETSPTIVLWCGARNPYSVTSTGQYMSLTFQSNGNNPYKYTGVHLEFQVFDQGSCGPGWSSPSPTHSLCYKLMTHAETWSKAQMFCNYNQANLAVIQTQIQQDYVKYLLTDRAWIGLSKVASESKMEWIDLSEQKLDFFATHDFQSNEDCVLMNSVRGEWQTADCSRIIANFVCQTNKQGSTTIYPVPEHKEEAGEQSSLSIILAGVLGSLVVIAAIIAAVVIYMKCFAKKRQEQPSSVTTRLQDSDNQSQSTTRNGSRNSGNASRTDFVFPSAPSMYEEEARHPDVAPPTYEETVINDIIKGTHV